MGPQLTVFTSDWRRARLRMDLPVFVYIPIRGSAPKFEYNLFTRRRANKAFYRNAKTMLLAYCHVSAGNHQRAYH